MKLVLNIEKKHLIFFGIFLFLIGSMFVIAEWDSSKPFHEPLYTNTIEPKSGGRITYGSSGNEKHIFKGKICSPQSQCISVDEIIKGINNGANEGESNEGESNEGESLHVTGDVAISDPNAYLRDNGITFNQICRGLVFGFQNSISSSAMLDKIWCDNLPSIKVDTYTYSVKATDTNFCGGDEVVCGGKDKKYSSQLESFLCCRITGRTVNLDTKRLVDSGSNGGNLFCGGDEVVCGGTNHFSSLDKIWCCKLHPP